MSDKKQPFSVTNTYLRRQIKQIIEYSCYNEVIDDAHFYDFKKSIRWKKGLRLHARYLN